MVLIIYQVLLWLKIPLTTELLKEVKINTFSKC